MNDSELDRRCAEILGWTNTKKCWEDPEVFDGVPPDHPTNDFGLPLYSVIKPYSTSLDACRELLEWVAEHRFSDEDGFIQTKEYCQFSDKLEDGCNGDIINILLATPRQICEAFVQCFGADNAKT